MNKIAVQRPAKGRKRAGNGSGIKFGTGPVVKRIITSRTFTVVIGVIVAVLIALTLWIRIPGPSTQASPQSMFHIANDAFSVMAVFVGEIVP